jgi:hypothetical protein
MQRRRTVWFTWTAARVACDGCSSINPGDGDLERQSGLVRWGRIGLIVSAWLYALCILVQVFLAGLSTGMLGGEPARWSDHVSFGQMIGSLPLLLIVFALVGRASIPTLAMSGAIFFLYGFQYVFANSDNGNVAALHAVNALVMFWLTTTIATQTQRLTFGRQT